MTKKPLEDSTRVNVINLESEDEHNDDHQSISDDEDERNDRSDASNASDNDNHNDHNNDDEETERQFRANGSESPAVLSAGVSSSDSSPERRPQFEIRFELSFSNTVVKDGNVVLYTIKSVRVADGSRSLVTRQYEDIEYLHHCLTTGGKIDGLIVPPLPPRPAIEPELALAKSRRQLGADSRTLIGDDFNKDCWHLQNYLRLVIRHPVFGASPALDSFLVEQELPPAPKIRRPGGLFTRIGESFDGWKSGHKDCDEFFQSERDFTTQYGAHVRDASDKFDAIVRSRAKLCEVLAHFSAALTLNLGDNESGASRAGNRFANLFSKGLDDYRHCLDVVSYNDELTLGNTLCLWSRCMDSHRDMLSRRTCLMIDYENANRALDKSKPNRRKEAEEAKYAAERAFKECSDVAQQEIKRFHRQRIEALALAVRKFAETQLVVAKDMLCVLHNCANNLKKFDVQ